MQTDDATKHSEETSTAFMHCTRVCASKRELKHKSKVVSKTRALKYKPSAVDMINRTRGVFSYTIIRLLIETGKGSLQLQMCSSTSNKGRM